MGSASSKYHKLEYLQRQQTSSQSSLIELKLNKLSYYEGESVSGTIFFETQQDYPECKLFLELKGKETVHLLISGINSLKERSILKEQSCIYSWEMLYSGRYVISFRFLLPKDIPASFFQLSHGLFSASIRYKLRASFYTKNQEQMNTEVNIMINDRLKSESKSISEENIYNLSSCCVPIGPTVLRATFEKNHCSPGDTATLIVEVDNSSSKIDGFIISLNLVHRLRLQIGCLPYSKTSILGCDSRFDMGRNLKKTVRLEVRIPNFLFRKTTKGEFIESQYYLEASCISNIGCITGGPVKIVCPIEMIYLEPPIEEADEPSSFDTISLPTVDVDFYNQKLMKNNNCKESFEMANPQMPNNFRKVNNME